jgi:hypothetical protein
LLFGERARGGAIRDQSPSRDQHLYVQTQVETRWRSSSTLSTKEDPRKEVPTIRDQIQARLEALKKELETGQAELQKVEMQRTYLHETELRISGAVQVLEELLAEEQSVGQPDGTDPSEAKLASVRTGGTEESS